MLVREDLGYGLRLKPSYDIGLAHLFRSASRVLVATRLMSEAAAGAGAPPRKIQVLEKGVDLERFRPAETAWRSGPGSESPAPWSLGVHRPLSRALLTSRDP